MRVASRRLASAAALALPIKFLVASGAKSAPEGVVSAGDLLEACMRPSEAWISFCNGFFQAVHDFGVVSGEVCPPSGMTRTQLTQIYVRAATGLFARSEAAEAESAFTVTLAIFANSFPCG